ncbi:MAG: hypothetical protein JXB07_04215 [Anaerolineae bacterium]|nr:hypothetical protein [Anaerolineae bacterium]
MISFTGIALSVGEHVAEAVVFPEGLGGGSVAGRRGIEIEREGGRRDAVQRARDDRRAATDDSAPGSSDP